MRKIIKVAVIGPECSGKTTLCKMLSDYFVDPWVPEYAREYLLNINRPYEEFDLLQIALEQIRRENIEIKNATNFIFCDTDVMNIQVWSEIKYQRCAIDLLKLVASTNYDLYILIEPTPAWEPDQFRETPNFEDRKKLYETYLEMVSDKGQCVYILNRERIDSVFEYLKGFLVNKD
ncbi:MAG: ATP-binding protein [Saprospiraceae bacterium]|nr:ATP-binding protein [Saprospiraceae bacterium]